MNCTSSTSSPVAFQIALPVVFYVLSCTTQLERADSRKHEVYIFLFLLLSPALLLCRFSLISNLFGNFFLNCRVTTWSIIFFNMFSHAKKHSSSLKMISTNNWDICKEGNGAIQVIAVLIIKKATVLKMGTQINRHMPLPYAWRICWLEYLDGLFSHFCFKINVLIFIKMPS